MWAHGVRHRSPHSIETGRATWQIIQLVSFTTWRGSECSSNRGRNNASIATGMLPSPDPQSVWSDAIVGNTIRPKREGPLRIRSETGQQLIAAGTAVADRNLRSGVLLIDVDGREARIADPRAEGEMTSDISAREASLIPVPKQRGWTSRQLLGAGLALVLLAGVVTLLPGGPAVAYCSNNWHFSIGWGGGYGRESYYNTGTCDNDNTYHGKNKDDTQDGFCMSTVYSEIDHGGTTIQTKKNCANNAWLSYWIYDNNSSGVFRNCIVKPGTDPCLGWVSMSTY